jgi:hypothetical protein
MIKKERNGQGAEGCSWECHAATVVGGSGGATAVKEGPLLATKTRPLRVRAA